MSFSSTDELPFEVLHSLGEGITLADREGRIFFSNRAADRILGVTATDASPDGWADYYGVFLPDRVTPFPTEAYPLVRALAGEETEGVEMWIRNPSVPEGVMISVTGRPLKGAAGAIDGAAVVFRDITELRAAHLELQRVNSSLQETQRLKDEISAFVVHDLKSPLTVIMGLADLMIGEERLQGEDLAGLRHIRDSASMIHRMVLDLLDIQLAADSALSPTLEGVDLGELLGEVSGALAPRAASSGHRLEVRVGQGPIAVAADRDLLRRVVQNLVDNCLKYAPAGTILLDAQAPELGRATLRVSDEGPGVPPELRERIFDLYATVERDQRMRHRDSRGLGLRFCRVAVEALGGRIWIEDNQPSGSRFCVELSMA